MGSEAKVRISHELIDWSDLIVVMEEAHLQALSGRFQGHLGTKRMVCLGIPDEYQYMDPTLVELLRQRVTDHLPPE